MAYAEANEVKQNESMDYTGVSANKLTAKVRIMSFSFTAEAAVADKAVIIAKLPAGRGRVLPLLSYYKTAGVTGSVTIGHQPYTDSMPAANNTLSTVVAENKTAFSASIAVSANNTQFAGSALGVEYHSLDDIAVVLYGTTIPKDAVVEGVIAYAVS